MGLSPEQMLDVWDRGRGQDPVDRALTLWAAAAGDAEVGRLAALPIGRRDAALLGLRVATFGSVGESFLHCQACDSGLEFVLDLSGMRLDAPDEGSGPFRLAKDGWHVTFRLPDSNDLRRVSFDADPAAALVEGCITDASRDGAPQPASVARAALADALEDEMGRLDPQADVEVDVNCASCGHQWAVAFDIASYLWREVEVEARRLLREVDALARTYGWSERDILAMGRRRRHDYLELATS